MGHSGRLTFEIKKWRKKISVAEVIVVPPHPILKNNVYEFDDVNNEVQ